MCFSLSVFVVVMLVLFLVFCFVLCFVYVFFLVLLSVDAKKVVFPEILVFFLSCVG